MTRLKLCCCKLPYAIYIYIYICVCFSHLFGEANFTSNSAVIKSRPWAAQTAAVTRQYHIGASSGHKHCLCRHKHLQVIKTTIVTTINHGQRPTDSENPMTIMTFNTYRPSYHLGRLDLDVGASEPVSPRCRGHWVSLT